VPAIASVIALAIAAGQSRCDNPANRQVCWLEVIKCIV
jgi:hypothetical protein